MTRRRRSRETLRERGMKPPHVHVPPRHEIECGWCEHETWETLVRARKLHDMTFNRYIIQEEPF